MRELLVRYLLGELDTDEQRQLEERLRASPELRRELAHMKVCFAAVNESDPPAAEPPCGLAERTSERVAGFTCGATDAGRSPGRAAAFAEAPAGALGWSLADLTVAGGVILAVSMLLFPALGASREGTRRRGCEANLHSWYLALSEFSDDHDGLLPRVNPHDYAGTIIVQLVSQEYATPEQAAQWLLCASSRLADDVRTGRVRIHFPDARHLQVMRQHQLAQLCRLASGSYAYPLGYVDLDGRNYHCPRNDGSWQTPLMSDEPSFELAGNLSANHCGGQNVLYADGAVRFQTVATVYGSDDELFLNRLGEPAAGRGPHDAVLVSGDKTPALGSGPFFAQPASTSP